MLWYFFNNEIIMLCHIFLIAILLTIRNLSIMKVLVVPKKKEKKKEEDKKKTSIGFVHGRV